MATELSDMQLKSFSLAANMSNIKSNNLNVGLSGDLDNIKSSSFDVKLDDSKMQVSIPSNVKISDQRKNTTDTTGNYGIPLLGQEIKLVDDDTTKNEAGVAVKAKQVTTTKLHIGLENIKPSTISSAIASSDPNTAVSEVKIVNSGYGLELKEHETKDVELNPFSSNYESWFINKDFFKKENFSNMLSNVKDFYSVNWNNANAKVADFYISSANEIGNVWKWENFGSKFTSDDSNLKWDNFKTIGAFNGDKLKEEIGKTLTINADGKAVETTFKEIKLSDQWALKAFDDWLGLNLTAGFNYGLAVANFTLDVVDNMMGSIKTMLNQSSTIAGTWISDVTGANFLGDWTKSKLKGLHFGDSDFYELTYLVDSKVEEAANPKVPTSKVTETSLRKNTPISILEYLNHSLPDEFSNLFDVYFVLTKKDEKQPSTDKSKDGSLPISSGDDDTKNVENTFPKILSSRIESITIPGRSVGTFEQKAMGSNITKSTTKLETKQRSSFVLQADNSLYWLHVFNKMSQTDFSNVETWKEDIVSTKLGTNGELPFNIYLSDYTLDIYVVAMDMEYQQKAPKENHHNVFWDADQYKAELKTKRKKRIEDERAEAKSIKEWMDARWGEASKEEKRQYKEAWEQKYKEIGKKISKTDDEVTQEMTSAQTTQSFQDLPSRIKWVFEDCRLLGSGTPISFKKDSSDPMKFTYDFTYRKLSKR